MRGPRARVALHQHLHLPRRRGGRHCRPFGNASSSERSAALHWAADSASCDCSTRAVELSMNPSITHERRADRITRTRECPVLRPSQPPESSAALMRAIAIQMGLPGSPQRGTSASPRNARTTCCATLPHGARNSVAACLRAAPLEHGLRLAAAARHLLIWRVGGRRLRWPRADHARSLVGSRSEASWPRWGALGAE